MVADLADADALADVRNKDAGEQVQHLWRQFEACRELVADIDDALRMLTEGRGRPGAAGRWINIRRRRVGNMMGGGEGGDREGIRSGVRGGSGAGDRAGWVVGLVG